MFYHLCIYTNTTDLGQLKFRQQLAKFITRQSNDGWYINQYILVLLLSRNVIYERYCSCHLVIFYILQHQYYLLLLYSFCSLSFSVTLSLSRFLFICFFPPTNIHNSVCETENLMTVGGVKKKKQ
jgi:hypothetical protein